MKKIEVCKCYTYEKEEMECYHRGRGFVAKASEVKNRPSEYEFCYDGFVDFENYEDFMSDLRATFARQTAVRVVPQEGEPQKLTSREQDICGDCRKRGSCEHTESFSKAWEVNFTLYSIPKCPRCKNETTQVRTIRPIILKFHDVRLSGHPARLHIVKTRQWECKYCGITISGTRIPGIQYVAGSELTLRLLRSIFELSIDGVPNGFIAEGYDLNRDYVGELCRRFKARTEEEFSKRREEVLAGMPSGSFYSEPVLLGGKRFRAIFSAEKAKFYTILPEEDIRAALQCLSMELPEIIAKASRRRLASLYAFSAVPPLRRQVASGLFEVMQAAQVESRLKILDDGAPQLPTLAADWLRRIITGERVELRQLHDFLSGKENFRTVNTAHSRFGGKTYLYRTLKKAEETAAFVRQIMEDMPELWRSENETVNNNILIGGLWELERSLQEGAGDQSRLPVTEAMERASAASPYSLSEQLKRLQFYNELALLPNQHNAKYAFPVMDEEDGMPWLEYSLLGRGVPVACLEHLLHTGLLQREPGGTKCFRQRQKGTQGCCTLKCPFL